MVPLADMMNFGPPCTKGQYNTQSKAFEVIATCPFHKGDEITFWYSDACQDIMMANYGFVHESMEKCKTVEDWKETSRVWEEYAMSLEQLLKDAYQDLKDAIEDLQHCDCSGDDYGSENVPENHERRRRRQDPQKQHLHSVEWLNDKQPSLPNVPLRSTPTAAASNSSATSTSTTAATTNTNTAMEESHHGRIRRTKLKEMEEHDEIGF